MDKLEKTLLIFLTGTGTIIGMLLSGDPRLAILMLLGGLSVILVIRRAR